MILYYMAVVQRAGAPIEARPFEAEDQAALWLDGVALGSEGRATRRIVCSDDVIEAADVRQACAVAAVKAQAEGWTLPNACGHYYSYRLCGDEPTCFVRAWVEREIGEWIVSMFL